MACEVKRGNGNHGNVALSIELLSIILRACRMFIIFKMAAKRCL